MSIDISNTNNVKHTVGSVDLGNSSIRAGITTSGFVNAVFSSSVA